MEPIVRRGTECMEHGLLVIRPEPVSEWMLFGDRRLASLDLEFRLFSV